MPCTRCTGLRVIEVIDRSRAATSPELAALLDRIDRQHRDLADQQELVAMELRYGC